MFRFVVTAGAGEITLGLIMRPTDLVAFRMKPLDDHVAIDCTPYGRPDVRIIITYARTPTQARKRARRAIRYNGSPTSCLTFSGKSGDQKLIGIVLTEANLAQFETAPLTHFEMFDDDRYALPGFKVLLTYADSERGIVHFMRNLGITPEQFTQDQNLRQLWDRFKEEAVDDVLRMAHQVGQQIPITEPVNVSLGDAAQSGMSETAMLAARGEELAWFRANPGETEYIRRAVPGELPASFKGVDWVKVVKVPPKRPGENVRIRIPMKRDQDGQFVEYYATTRSNE